MNFNFFLTLFSVFYSKYSYYCYEVSKNMPLRYFDGNEWKIMKSRTQTNLAPILSNISIDLEWSETNEGNQKTDKVKNTVQTKATKRVTQKVTKRVTQKVMKKITPKIARKATTTKCNSCGSCNIKTTAKAVPRANKWLTTRKSNLRTTKRTPSKMIKNNVKTTTKTPVRTLKKFPVQSAPAISAKKYTANCNGRNGCLNESQALPENWVNVIKKLVDTLKNIENKKNNIQYETENEPKLNLEYPLVDGRRAMEGMEDIMNLLMDGVEIDDRPVDTNSLDYNLLPVFKGMFEYQDTMLDLNETENLFAVRNWNTTQVKDLILNKNNQQILDLESNTDARHVKKYGENFQNRAIKAYLDLLKSEYATEDALQYRDAPLDLNAINAVIENKRPDSEFREDAEYKDYFKESDLKTYLNAKNHASSAQNRNLKTYLDLIKSKLITRDNLQISEALLDTDAVNPVNVTKNSKPIVLKEDNDLELYLQPYINKFYDKYGSEKDTIGQDGSGYIAKNDDGFKGLDLRPYLNEMNSQYEAKNQDGFKGLDLGPYLNEMHVNYATQNQDSLENTITKYRDDTMETTSADLNEIADLIASKDTNSEETNKYKNLLKDKHVQNLLKTRFQISKYKYSLQNSRETVFNTDEEIKNEKNNPDAIENVNDENLYFVTSETVAAEENGSESDDYHEQKQTDINGDRELEGNGQMAYSFKYPLDDREQNEINEDYAFIWGGDGEIFQMPKPRPTLAS